jgi:hypothetical protein
MAKRLTAVVTLPQTWAEMTSMIQTALAEAEKITDGAEKATRLSGIHDLQKKIRFFIGSPQQFFIKLAETESPESRLLSALCLKNDP